MPKILLCTLNSKYIHTSLALRYLLAGCRERYPQTILREFTINEPLAGIRAEIFSYHPDILCFSCYIWNINLTLQICQDIKKVLPQTIIILGGPEVSFNSAEVLQTYNSIDFILKGDGDFTFIELLDAISAADPVDHIQGLVYRDNGRVIETPGIAIVQNLDLIPAPYGDSGLDLKNRLVYYETSRGCPFNCAYCLSSTIKGVRFFSLERVKRDLAFLISCDVKAVKFVDRTFNCREDRALEIMKFILKQPGKTRFHFEICADLLSSSMLEFLAQAPAGIFDFEIGVQSTYPAALQAVNRKTDWPRLSYNFSQLKKNNNIHLHLDLIAGLPYEDYEHFANSFNMVYQLRPHVLQLGFLKMLKGSHIREEAAQYGYLFEEAPPYQVLQNDYINYEELIKLTRIEDLVDKYFNSGDFETTLQYVCNTIYQGNAFAFYEDFAQCWDNQGRFRLAHRKDALYSFLKEFLDDYPEHKMVVNELLKLDYLRNYKAYELPQGIERCNPPDINDQLNQLLKSDFVNKHLNLKTSRSTLRKNVVLEFFRLDPFNLNAVDQPIPLLFVYAPGNNKCLQVLSNIKPYMPY